MGTIFQRERRCRELVEWPVCGSSKKIKKENLAADEHRKENMERIIESNISGSGELLEKVFEALLPRLIGDMSMVDIGCGEGRTTGQFNFKNKIFIDSMKPAGKTPEPFHQGDALQFLKDSSGFDVLFALDFIEHLTKEKGNYLLDLTDIKIKNISIFFTPLGSLAQSNPNEKYNPHKHWSGWLPEEFIARGYEVAIFHRWHNPWEDGKVHGAFFAWKTKDSLTGSRLRELLEEGTEAERHQSTVDSLPPTTANCQLSLTASVAICNPDIEIFRKFIASLKKYTPELSHLIIIDNASESKEFKNVLSTAYSVPGKDEEGTKAEDRQEEGKKA